jgi:dTDP-4-dehydrorhamnose 3,5-epimerase
MSDIRVVQGEIFQDHRGQISSLNNFHFEGVRRCYVIYHPDESVIRGWHGHQHERKWFYCIKGSFTLALVKVDNWENPSPELTAEIFELNESESKIVCVPAGYANCLKANTPGSILEVFSDKRLAEAVHDSWRYDSNMWVDWSQYK